MGAAQAQSPDKGVEVLRQFDFWLGEWDLSWGDDGRATNSIYLDFDGRVIVESFDGRPSLTLQGMSVSTYDLDAGCWRQTWVDNHGNYYSFRGGLTDGEMDLRTEKVVEGMPMILRMRWYGIREDGLQWAWERSEDGGQSWETTWAIEYTRVL
jgi:hypothetical protein